jgi:transposase InsO family protein
MKPLRFNEAKEIAEALFEEVFCRHGNIEIVVSDNGTEFVNRTMKQFHELIQSKRLTTTPYNPQSNGCVEIFNRTLGDMLCAYLNSNQKKLD